MEKDPKYLKMKMTKKPPIIQVVTDSLAINSHCVDTIKRVIEPDRYIVQQFKTNLPHYECILVVVIGNVVDDLCASLFKFLKNGGNMICLYSNFMRKIHPDWLAVKFGDQKIVKITYKNYENVSLLTNEYAYKTPNSILDNVTVLGTEHAFQTPFLVLTKFENGTVMFCQQRLEFNPFLSSLNIEYDKSLLSVLQNDDKSRLGIIRDILNDFFSFKVASNISFNDSVVLSKKHNILKSEMSYLIGADVLKNKFLENRELLITNNVFKNSKISLLIVPDEKQMDIYNEWSDTFRPLVLNGSPENFCALRYFSLLKTTYLGRLIIFFESIGSTSQILCDPIMNGIAVIASQQTKGKGRAGNVWLSPKGAASVSFQLNFNLESIIGQKLSLLQCIVATAIINAFRTLPNYDNLPLFIKWPNDIYTNNSVKIGGILVETSIVSDVAICMFGVGINVNNELPTVSLNSLIRQHCEGSHTISLEEFFAIFFNRLESMLEQIKKDGNLDLFFDLYYKYWIHNDQEITVLDQNNKENRGKIVGIDDYGFLQVRLQESGKITTVHPHENSFDMLNNMIIPK